MKKGILLIVMMGMIGLSGRGQTWDWAKSFGGNKYDRSNSMSTDAYGNSYITGEFFSATLSFGNTTLTNTDFTTITGDMYIAKFDSMGNVIWAKQAIGSGEYYEEGMGIKTDANGNNYVTGFFESPTLTLGGITLYNPGGNSTGDFFVAKYDSSGNVLWAHSAGGSDEDGGDAISIDAMGNAYVIGTFRSPTITFGNTTLTNTGSTYVWDFFIVKYDTDGNVLWAKSAGGADIDGGGGIYTDALGYSYVTGYFRSTSITFGGITLTNASIQYDDIFVVKYDPSGNVIWAKRAGGDSYDAGMGISADGDGNCYVTGYFESPTISFGNTTLTNVDISGYTEDFFIVKYDPSGNSFWARSGGGVYYDGGTSITNDSLGNSYVTGKFNSPSFRLAGHTFFNTCDTNYSTDFFMAKYSPNGNIMWADKFGGTYYDGCNSIILDVNGAVLITGIYTSPTLSIGTTTLTISGSNSEGDIFVGKLNPFIGIIDTGIAMILPPIFPNPFTTSTTLTLQGSYHSPTLFIYNLMGQEVRSMAVGANNQVTIQRNNLPAGMYFYKLVEENKVVLCVGKLIAE